MRKTKFFVLLLFPSACFAMSETQHNLTVSGGIAETSSSTAVFQNPAGLVNGNKLELNVQGGTDSSFGSPLVSGGLMYGDGSFGVSAGVRNTSASTLTSAYYGLAVGIPSWRTSIGISGSTGVSPSTGTSLNAGFQTMPSSHLKLGVTALGINSTIQEWGGGIGLVLDPAFTLLVDASLNPFSNTVVFKPGIGITSASAGLTVSYGTATGSQQLSSGLTAGANLNFSKKVNLEFYYNMLSNLYASLTIHL